MIQRGEKLIVVAKVHCFGDQLLIFSLFGQSLCLRIVEILETVL